MHFRGKSAPVCHAGGKGGCWQQEGSADLCCRAAQAWRDLVLGGQSQRDALGVGFLTLQLALVQLEDSPKCKAAPEAENSTLWP